MNKEDFVKDLLTGNIKMEEGATNDFGGTEEVSKDEVEEAMNFLSSIILGEKPKQEKAKNTTNTLTDIIDGTWKKAQQQTRNNQVQPMKNEMKEENDKRIVFNSMEDLYKYIQNENNESNKELDNKIEESEKKLANDMVRRSKEEAGTIGDRTSYKRREQEIENKNDIKDTIKTSIDTIEVTKGEKFKRGDKVRIARGDYKALSDKKYKFIDYCKGMDKVLLQLDEFSSIYINPEDIELIKPKTIQYNRFVYDKIINKNIEVHVVQSNSHKFIDVFLNKNRNDCIREKFEEEKDIHKLIIRAYCRLIKSFYERELNKKC